MNTRRTMSFRISLAFVAMVGTAGPALADAPGFADGVSDADPGFATTYSELRLGIGGGGTTAGKNAEYDEEGVVALNASFVQRYGGKLFGANLSVQEALFGATHTFVGGLIGVALGGADAHMELLGEGGLHVMTGLGDDLFSSVSSGQSTAAMPYIGGQVRAVFDIGDPNGVQLELSAHARSDLSRDKRDIMVESCFFGCTTESETWDLGGFTANAMAGLSYQFK